MVGSFEERLPWRVVHFRLHAVIVKLLLTAAAVVFAVALLPAATATALTTPQGRTAVLAKMYASPWANDSPAWSPSGCGQSGFLPGFSCNPGAHTVTATAGTAIGEADLTGGGLTVTTSTLGAAWIGTPYSQILEAQGGTAPYTWQIVGAIAAGQNEAHRTSGGLPGGLALDPSTGVISGTLPPSASCVYCDFTDILTVQVTDAKHQTASQSVPLLVAGTPPPCSSGCALGAALSGNDVLVTSPSYVPANCWVPLPGFTYPDGNPYEYTDWCGLAAFVLDSGGAYDDVGEWKFADANGGSTVAGDGQDPSTFDVPFALSTPICPGLADHAENPTCAGDKTWLELWFTGGETMPTGPLLGISNEVTLPGRPATISGSVQNRYGVGIPDVQVTIVDASSGNTESVMTDSSGNYSRKDEPPGAYTVAPKPTDGRYIPQASSDCAVQGNSCAVTVTGSNVDADFKMPKLPVVLVTGLSDSHPGMWPGGALVPANPSLPPGCGSLGSTASLCAALQGELYPVYVPSASDSAGDVIFDTNAVRPNAESLANYLKKWVGGPALLVGHSMGGLFSRDAIAHGAQAVGLFAIGTPFDGSYGADVAEADSRAQCGSGLSGAKCKSLQGIADGLEFALGAAAVADLTAVSRHADNTVLPAIGVPTWTIAGTACGAVTAEQAEDSYEFPNDGIVGQSSAWGGEIAHLGSLGPPIQWTVTAYHSPSVRDHIGSLGELIDEGECVKNAPLELQTSAVSTHVLEAAYVSSFSDQANLRAHAASDTRASSRKPVSFTVNLQTLTVRSIRPGAAIPLGPTGFVSTETTFQLRCPHTAPVGSEPVLGSSKLFAVPGAAFKCQDPSLRAAKPVTAMIASDPDRVRASLTPTPRGYQVSITALNALSRIVLEQHGKRVRVKLRWRTRRSVSLSLTTSQPSQITLTATANRVQYSASL